MTMGLVMAIATGSGKAARFMRSTALQRTWAILTPGAHLLLPLCDVRLACRRWRCILERVATVIVVLGLCGSGKSTLVNEMELDGRRKFDEGVNKGGRQYEAFLAAVRQGSDCVISDIDYYSAASRETLLSDLQAVDRDIRVSWICFSNDRARADYNCRNDRTRTAEQIRQNLAQNEHNERYFQPFEGAQVREIWAPPGVSPAYVSAAFGIEASAQPRFQGASHLPSLVACTPTIHAAAQSAVIIAAVASSAPSTHVEAEGGWGHVHTGRNVWGNRHGRLDQLNDWAASSDPFHHPEAEEFRKALHDVPRVKCTTLSVVRARVSSTPLVSSDMGPPPPAKATDQRYSVAPSPAIYFVEADDIDAARAAIDREVLAHVGARRWIQGFSIPGSLDIADFAAADGGFEYWNAAFALAESPHGHSKYSQTVGKLVAGHGFAGMRVRGVRGDEKLRYCNIVMFAPAAGWDDAAWHPWLESSSTPVPL
jgi:hypothetical protein